MGSYRIDDGVVDLGGSKLPVPDSVSPEAQAYLSTHPWGEEAQNAPRIPMWHTREFVDPAFQMLNDVALQIWPCEVEDTQVAGVHCHRIRRKNAPVAVGSKAMLNLHGGGFVIGSGALGEAIPIAGETGVEVVAIDYRLAPEHPFPAAIDDIVAVYRAFLDEGYGADDIVLFGTSAGGFLTAMTVMRLKREGLPLPCCCGVFTAGGDVANLGDTFNYMTLAGFYGHIGHEMSDPECERAVFLGGADRDDPIVAPIKGDLSDFPPTLLVTGTRDAVLSSAAMFHRALRRAGREAELYVFEAMPHAHWYAYQLPEAREAIDVMARFFERHLEL
ncbi:alpha/beta hydrolase [Parafrankia sp. BMG5.11]|uniref:alpha/beta hydrolase n=1 Tax=Parafrankia sp. BMG5.11 TaxID=222540 RepID=UPI00103D98E2|nr:alpha/beta hydrolase [Parafrankia sp. BMG5.11]TCJ37053.1 alpha/beta hydrolase [Parafrankia sp. BMG5.11]